VILGVGVDLVEVARLERALARRPGLRERLFAPEELTGIAGAGAARSLAARFAAKEAARKAVGSAVQGAAWRDARVLGGRTGPPRLELHGRLQDAARALGAARWHLSLAHERDYAVAVVVIES